MINICVVRGNDKGKELRTDRSILSVGRAKECDLVLSDTRVSHLHGEFLFTGRRCFYRDLNSRNGSYVRSSGDLHWLGPLEPDCEVQAGDTVSIGGAELLVETVVPEAACMTDQDSSEMLETVAVDAGSAAGTYVGALSETEIGHFRDFLELPCHDATSVDETKAAVCDALSKVFPNVACVALVDLLPGPQERLAVEAVDQDGVAFAPRTGDPLIPKYSFAMLADAYAQRALVCYGMRSALPDTESVCQASMESCICLPLWRAGEITGFLQMYTVPGDIPLTPRDAHLLRLLGQVASLLLNRAADAQDRARWRAVAAAGDAVSGLSHEALPILETLGANSDAVVLKFPDLARNQSWKYVQEDLKFLRWITRDAIRRAKSGQGNLETKRLQLRSIVDEALDVTGRYFLDATRAGDVRLINACHESAHVTAHREALRMALGNCLKNAMGPLKDAWSRGQPCQGTIRVTSCDAPEDPRNYCLISVCDDVGGIPAEVLRHFGDPFASGKNSQGLGLGMHLVGDTVGRMGGHVRVATSRRPRGDLPAGSVVSLCLPKTPESRASVDETHDKRLTVIPDYVQYRKMVEGPASKEVGNGD